MDAQCRVSIKLIPTVYGHLWPAHSKFYVSKYYFISFTFTTKLFTC